MYNVLQINIYTYYIYIYWFTYKIITNIWNIRESTYYSNLCRQHPDRRVIPYKRNRFECRLPGCQEEWRLRHILQVNFYQHVVLFQNLGHYHVSPHHVPQSYPLPIEAAFTINQLFTSAFSSEFSQVSILRPCLYIIMTNASAPYYFGISREHVRTWTYTSRATTFCLPVSIMVF